LGSVATTSEQAEAELKSESQEGHRLTQKCALLEQKVSRLQKELQKELERSEIWRGWAVEAEERIESWRHCDKNAASPDCD
jgi:hypothetical protein